jgi:hypothetical protein
VGFFPIGTTVDVEETCGAPNFLQLDGGDCNEFIDVSGEGEITIAPGVNTKTITNTAKGLLEVCKAKVRDLNDDKQPTFTFRIDGGTPFGVQAGKCSPAKRVSVGNHMVTESASTDYELDSYRADGGIAVFPADREISRNLPTRSVTVSVPYGPNGETLVTFYNRIRRGQIKVCKQVTPGSVDALGTKAFSYDVFVGTGAHDFPLSDIHPGECAYVADSHGGPQSFPVLDPSGNPLIVGVRENGASELSPPPPGSFYVSDVSVTGSRGNIMTNCLPALYSPTGKHCKLFSAAPPASVGLHVHISFNLGVGMNVVTFTNSAGDP